MSFFWLRSSLRTIATITATITKATLLSQYPRPSYDQKQGLVNATIELLRSRSTRRSHKRRRRGGSKANTSNTYVVLDWRLHFGTGPSVEYLIMRDGSNCSNIIINTRNTFYIGTHLYINLLSSSSLHI